MVLGDSGELWVVIFFIYLLFSCLLGKRLNVLKNCVDSAEYGTDQLVLGTIVLTVLVFLLPTVLMYYCLFSLSWIIVVVIVQSGLEIVLAVVNHFPLFALLLRLKDSYRLPCEVFFHYLNFYFVYWLFLSWSKIRTDPTRERRKIGVQGILFSLCHIWK